MDKIYIIGSYMIKTGNYIDKTVLELTQLAVEGVLKDAKIPKEDIGSAHFGNCGWGWFQGQHCIRGHLAMRACGMDRIPVTNHESACATGSLALHTAIKDILAGFYDCTLAVGVEKLNDEDKRKTLGLFSAGLANYTDEVRNAAFAKWANIRSLAKDVPIPEYDERGRSPFMDWYATIGLAHMQRFGTTMEDFATISAKNHTHSQLNPLAHYQFPMTVEEVMKDYMVSYPLTRSMCAPTSDGAAAAIVCSEDYFKRLPQEVRDRAVLVRASSYVSGPDKEITALTPETVLFGTSIFASRAAYEMAGLGPDDIQVAEVHDATAIGELGQYEYLGFCKPGEGGAFARSGATKLGGKIPINVSGGLESRGHPIAASGLCMIYEITTQLRAEAGARQVENARIGMVENGGGIIDYDEASCCVHILERL